MQDLDWSLLGQFLQEQSEQEQFFPSSHFWHESPQLERDNESASRRRRRAHDRYTHSHDFDSTLFGQFLHVHLAHEQFPSPHFLHESPQLRVKYSCQWERSPVHWRQDLLATRRRRLVGAPLTRAARARAVLAVAALLARVSTPRAMSGLAFDCVGTKLHTHLQPDDDLALGHDSHLQAVHLQSPPLQEEHLRSHEQPEAC